MRREGAFLALWLGEHFTGMAEYTHMVQGWAMGDRTAASQFYWWEEGATEPPGDSVENPDRTLYQGLTRRGASFARRLHRRLDPSGECPAPDEDLPGWVDRALQRVEEAARSHLGGTGGLFQDIERQFFRWFGVSVAWAIVTVVREELRDCRARVELEQPQGEDEEDALDQIPAPIQEPDLVTLIEQEDDEGLIARAREFLCTGGGGALRINSVLRSHAEALVNCVKAWAQSHYKCAPPKDREKLTWFWILGYLREDLRLFRKSPFSQSVGECLRQTCCREQNLWNHTMRLRESWKTFLSS